MLVVVQLGRRLGVDVGLCQTHTEGQELIICGRFLRVGRTDFFRDCAAIILQDELTRPGRGQGVSDEGDMVGGGEGLGEKGDRRWCSTER